MTRSTFYFMPTWVYFSVASASTLSCLVSILGSMTVVFLIVRHGRLRHSIYQRLMCGLSLCDFASALAILVTPYTTPRDTGLPLAVGNQDTCRATFVLILQGFGSFLYSPALSLYFLMMIRYGISEKVASRWLEPWVHLVACLFPLSFGIAALQLDVVNPDPVMFGTCLERCKVVGDLGMCEEDNDTEATITSRALRPLVIDPLFIAAIPAGIFSVVWTWLVYRTVNKQEEASKKKYAFSSSKQSRAVARQCMFYTLANFNCLVVTAVVFTLRNFERVDVSMLRSQNHAYHLYPLALGLLYPIQGLLNAMIYCRPTFSQWRSIQPQRGLWWAYCQVISGESPQKEREVKSMPENVPSAPVRVSNNTCPTSCFDMSSSTLDQSSATCFDPSSSVTVNMHGPPTAFQSTRMSLIDENLSLDLDDIREEGSILSERSDELCRVALRRNDGNNDENNDRTRQDEFERSLQIVFGTYTVQSDDTIASHNNRRNLAVSQSFFTLRNRYAAGFTTTGTQSCSRIGRTTDLNEITP